jgi:hypothetical protein
MGESARQTRLRQAAVRKGLRLAKARNRRWLLTSPDRQVAVFGAWADGVDLDLIEAYLTRAERERSA